MKYLITCAILALSGAGLLAGCSAPAGEAETVSYEQQVMEWRKGRRDRLLAPTGYLNQVGLFWLRPGEYSIGSDEDSDVRLPATAAATVGSLLVDDRGITFKVADGVQVWNEGAAVDALLLADDTTDAPVTVTHRSIAWNVIFRDERFAVRVRDFEHPFAKNFGELPYFDIDPTLRVEAVLKRYAEPVTANVGTVIEGLGYHPQSPGVVQFELGGEVHQLEAYQVGERLFYVFGDLTNRDATYGAGRFLYSEMPGDDGVTVLDFNKSYSPPCAFNDFSTCPVASPRNRLKIRIEAGEKFDPALHYAGET